MAFLSPSPSPHPSPTPSPSPSPSTSPSPHPSPSPPPPISEASLALQLSHHLPLHLTRVNLPRGSKVGLVIVDEVNGFCTVGMGNLAPPVPNKQILDMVRETLSLALSFSSRNFPILAFLDTHDPDRPEPPYPPHCVRGTGEELLVDDLKWLESYPHTTLIRKDCINGFVGGIQKDGSNKVVDWVKKNDLKMIFTVGICTDICVMDFVLTALSARNHGTFGESLETIGVCTQACATYDLPRQVAENQGLGIYATHPQDPTHHMGLYFMQSRGAILLNGVDFNEEGED